MKHLIYFALNIIIILAYYSSLIFSECMILKHLTLSMLVIHIRFRYLFHRFLFSLVGFWDHQNTRALSFFCLLSRYLLFFCCIARSRMSVRSRAGLYNLQLITLNTLTNYTVCIKKITKKFNPNELNEHSLRLLYAQLLWV